jgi:non-heme chloroperoxidase
MAVKPVEYRGDTFRIAYDIKNPNGEKTIVFLHGWGSNKELMAQAFSHALPHWRHIYLDLPGFGKSDNDAVLTTADYAAIVSEFLDAINTRANVAVGHSFGGKIATLLMPDALILLSSAGIVMPKPWKVRLKIALYKALKPFAPGAIRNLFVSADAAGMPPNMYETFKKVVDEDFSHTFESFRSPALLCWGKNDTATPLEAGEKIASLMPNATLKVFEGDHYFFLHNSAPVIKSMEDFLEKI